MAVKQVRSPPWVARRRCTALRLIILDVSATARGDTDGERQEQGLSALRSIHGHHAIVWPQPDPDRRSARLANGASLGDDNATAPAPAPANEGGSAAERLVVTHVIVATSRLVTGDVAHPVGRGVFALTPLVPTPASPTACPHASSTAGITMVAQDHAAVLQPLPASRSIVGYYTGQVLSPDEWEESTSGADAGLATMTTGRGANRLIRDPRREGGITWLLNLGHGDKANAQSRDVRLRGRPISLLEARAEVLPGQELLWDYGATTTDPHDVLLNVPCACCGELGLVRLLQA